VSGLVLDTHVIHWWSTEPERISPVATAAITTADELAVADITWFELAWLARRERIVVAIPVEAWLRRLAAQVRTVPISPTIAANAAGLSTTFPGDPADRLIFATAVEMGWQLVSKDRRMAEHPYPRQIVVW